MPDTNALIADPQPGLRRIDLPTGVLTIRVDRAAMPLDALCGFAARRNPKRGFLFVSKVLGKHVPVRPSAMAAVHAALAARIPADLPGPVVFVGMAETAIALGQGVFAAWRRASGRDDALFLHSTRYRIDASQAFDFLEEHSHAADHILYRPEEPRLRALFDDARSLVIVDDEASTGNTFVNLARAFAAGRRLEAVVPVVLTDWRGPARAAAMVARMPAPGGMVSLLEGEWSFEAGPPLPAPPSAVGDGAPKDGIAGRGWGRLGLDADPEIDSALIPACAPGERILVVGTGEFAYPPFLVAQALEARGANVWAQSTTRSPILVGGAIGDALSFPDNYGDGIPNHVYNARSARWDRVIVCAETPTGSLPTPLIDALNAETLHLPDPALRSPA